MTYYRSPISSLTLVLIILILLAMIACPAPPVHAQTALPAPVSGHLVQDFGHGLLASEAATLDAKLLAYEKASGNEISVASIFSLEGDSIDEYAPRLFKQWGIGKKGKDNGVLILWAIKDRKVRIEVGYGLEDRITDGRAGTILRNNILPKFKTANFFTGLDNGVDAIVGLLTIPPTTPTDLNTAIPPTASTDLMWLWIFLGLGLVGIVAYVIYLMTREDEQAYANDFSVRAHTISNGVAAANISSGYSYAPSTHTPPSYDSTPSYGSGSSSASSPSFDFGGGISGGAGASGSY